MTPDQHQSVLTDATAFEGRWRTMRRKQTHRLLLFAIIAVITLWLAGGVAEFDAGLLWRKLPKLTNYVSETIPVIRFDSFGTDLANWMWGIKRWLGLILDTLIIAFLGTVFGGILALISSFLAARNLAPSRGVGIAARRLQEIARTVPELVYALIFVFAFGIGPFAGVLAILLHTWGTLGKLISEVNENIDMGPVDGMHATGCSWLSMIRFAVLPQVMPNVVSYGLFRFEVNVRAASVLGIVGAGGIGTELYFVIRQFEYTDISAIILLIVILVSLIDMSSEKLRHWLMGDQTAVAL